MVVAQAQGAFTLAVFVVVQTDSGAVALLERSSLG